MQTIRLDVSQKNNVQTLYVKQRDVGHTFVIELYENGVPYEVNEENNFAVWFSGASGDGNYTEIGDETAVSVDGNRIEVQMIMQMLNEPGDHEMCVVMYGQDNEQKGFWNIPYSVEAIPGADSKAAEQYYSAFFESVVAAKDAAARAEEAYENINEELEKRGQLKPEFANDISECTDPSKLYVLPDGYIYAYMYTETGVPEITVEEKTGGYWYADEWNPLGSTVSLESACAKRTNVFAVTPGDQLSYTGFGELSADSVVWLDASKSYVSDAQIDARSNAVTVTVPEGVAYAWFASFGYTTTADAVLLDVKWLLCQASVKQYAWTNTGHAFVPADYEDRIIELEKSVDALEGQTGTSGVADSLAGKKIVYDGDSICAGYGASGGYAAQVAAVTGGIFVNQAVGGGRLTSSNTVHSVVDNLANLPTDGDLYCFEGGINDYWANIPLGELDPSDYNTVPDKSTFAGALEYILRYAISTFVGKPICFVIVHKIQNTSNEKNENGKEFDDYVWMIRMACEKYSIPYYDAYKDSGLNGWNDAQNRAFLTGNGENAPDGTHPNVEGYKRYYVPQLLSLFRSLMPGVPAEIQSGDGVYY